MIVYSLLSGVDKLDLESTKDGTDQRRIRNREAPTPGSGVLVAACIARRQAPRARVEQWGAMYLRDLGLLGRIAKSAWQEPRPSPAEVLVL